MLRDRSPDLSQPPLRIPDLVYPYRYDIIVRRRFLQFYEEHSELYRRDPGGFTRRACETEYFRYFCASRVGRMDFLPGWLQLLRRRHLFPGRVKRFISVLESVRRKGFDPTHQLVVYTTGGKVTTREGKQLDRPAVLRDGRHRLAVLMHLGYTELPAELWRSKGPSPKPARDLTLWAWRTGLLDDRGYFELMREYYGSPDQQSWEQMLSEASDRAESVAARAAKPEHAQVELVRTLRFDWEAMGRMPPQWLQDYAGWTAGTEGMARSEAASCAEGRG